MRSYCSSVTRARLGSEEFRSFATSDESLLEGVDGHPISDFSRSLKTREIIRQSCTSPYRILSLTMHPDLANDAPEQEPFTVMLTAPLDSRSELAEILGAERFRREVEHGPDAAPCCA